MTEQRRTTVEEARRVGDAIGVDWSRFDLEQFRAGMDMVGRMRLTGELFNPLLERRDIRGGDPTGTMSRRCIFGQRWSSGTAEEGQIRRMTQSTSTPAVA